MYVIGTRYNCVVVFGKEKIRIKVFFCVFCNLTTFEFAKEKVRIKVYNKQKYYELTKKLSRNIPHNSKLVIKYNIITFLRFDIKFKSTFNLISFGFGCDFVNFVVRICFSHIFNRNRELF